MKDAIELHTVRTLALIASAPENVRRRLSGELRDAHRADAAKLSQNWISSRRASRKRCDCGRQYRFSCGWRSRTPNCPDKLPRVEKGRQILMHTGSYHRNPGGIWRRRRHVPPGATRIAESPAAPGDRVDPPLYVFSRHQQSCAGPVSHHLPAESRIGSLLVKTNVRPAGAGRLPWTRCRRAIDHFAIRFWRADSMAGVLPPVLSRR